jgi:hypothetical protein
MGVSLACGAFYGDQDSVDCKRLQSFPLRALAGAARGENCCNFVAGIRAVSRGMVPLPSNSSLYCGSTFFPGEKIYRWPDHEKSFITIDCNCLRS